MPVHIIVNKAAIAGKYEITVPTITPMLTQSPMPFAICNALSDTCSSVMIIAYG